MSKEKKKIKLKKVKSGKKAGKKAGDVTIKKDSKSGSTEIVKTKAKYTPKSSPTEIQGTTGFQIVLVPAHLCSDKQLAKYSKSVLEALTKASSTLVWGITTSDVNAIRTCASLRNRFEVDTTIHDVSATDKATLSANNVKEAQDAVSYMVNKSGTTVFVASQGLIVAIAKRMLDTSNLPKGFDIENFEYVMVKECVLKDLKGTKNIVSYWK